MISHLQLFFLHTSSDCDLCCHLGEIEGTKHEHMVVVFGERDNIALRRDFKAAATAHFHVWTLKLASELALSAKHGHVKAVAMTVSNKDVASVTHINAIRVVSDGITANTA